MATAEEKIDRLLVGLGEVQVTLARLDERQVGLGTELARVAAVGEAAGVRQREAIAAHAERLERLEHTAAELLARPVPPTLRQHLLTAGASSAAILSLLALAEWLSTHLN